MSWLELSTRCDPEAVESLSEVFSARGYNQGVVVEEEIIPGREGDDYEIDHTKPVWVRTYLANDAEAPAKVAEIEKAVFYLGKLRYIEPLMVTERREEEWANAWKEFYQVHRIARHTVIKPAWQDYEPQAEDVVISLDPGMAFGTGLHPTTRLCLAALEERVTELQGKDLLDLGAGSGILAIAAALHGAKHIDALDTDAIAVKASGENAARNNVLFPSGAVEPALGSLAELEEPRYDFIVANIIAKVIIALSPVLYSALRPGGALVTSGIINERGLEVWLALTAAGFEEIVEETQGDWLMIAARKPLLQVELSYTFPPAVGGLPFGPEGILI